MPCMLGCLALMFPRIILVLVAIFSDYLGRAYDNMIWPILGFFFLPLTTLAYAFAMNQTGGHVNGFYLVIVVVAVLVDLGMLGGGGTLGRSKYRTPPK